MRSRVLLAAAVLALSATAASARSGCSDNRHRLDSRNYSLGPNAKAPSRAIMNPCSSMYDFGKNLRAREKRRYPGAVVRH